MGKTIQTLALLVSDYRKPNLVVAPTVAIMQWKNEIEVHTEGLKVCVFHGATRTKEVEELKTFDIVLTTYAVLESSYRKQHSGFKRKGQMVKEASPLHALKWARIIVSIELPGFQVQFCKRGAEQTKSQLGSLTRHTISRRGAAILLKALSDSGQNTNGASLERLCRTGWGSCTR